MRILHAAETIKGGVASVLNELVEDQSTIYGAENVISLIPDAQLSFFSSVSKNDAKTFNRTGRNVKSLINFSKTFFSLVKNNSIDVIHLHSTFAGFLGRVLLIFMNYKGRIIYCPHAFSFLMSLGKCKKLIYIAIERILQYKTDYIICVSHYESHQASKAGLDKNKLKVIYNGVSGFPKYNESPEKYENVNVFVVTFVGRFDYQKGIDVLELAIRELANHQKKYKYVFNIIGEAVIDDADNEFFSNIPERSDLELNLLGWLNKDALGDIYSKSHVVVMPSRWEGFGLVAIESFQYGTPVIASRNSSLKELITEGVHGYLFETGSSDELCDILLNIDLAMLKIMSVECLNNFNANFTSDKMKSETRSLYL